MKKSNFFVFFSLWFHIFLCSLIYELSSSLSLNLWITLWICRQTNRHHLHSRTSTSSATTTTHSLLTVQNKISWWLSLSWWCDDTKTQTQKPKFSPLKNIFITSLTTFLISFNFSTTNQTANTHCTQFETFLSLNYTKSNFFIFLPPLSLYI